MTPFEFTVPGPPVSLQAKPAALRKWKVKVRSAAAQHWPSGPATSDRVMVTLYYFYDTDLPGQGILDADNIAKPILDALIGLIYTDDRQVDDVVIRKRNLKGTFRLSNASPVLVQGLSTRREFLYVRVEDAPDPQDIRT